MGGRVMNWILATGLISAVVIICAVLYSMYPKSCPYCGSRNIVRLRWKPYLLMECKSCWARFDELVYINGIDGEDGE